MNRHALKLIHSIEAYRDYRGWSFVRKGDPHTDEHVKYHIAPDAWYKWPGQTDSYLISDFYDLGWIDLPERLKIVLRMAAFPEVLPDD